MNEGVIEKLNQSYSIEGLSESQLKVVKSALALNEEVECDGDCAKCEYADDCDEYTEEGYEVLDEDTKWVVRDGQKKKITIKKKKRSILTPGQKRALALARKKAHSAAANKKRAKSVAKSQKLNESTNLNLIEKLVEAKGNKLYHRQLLNEGKIEELKIELLK